VDYRRSANGDWLRRLVRRRHSMFFYILTDFLFGYACFSTKTTQCKMGVSFDQKESEFRMAAGSQKLWCQALSEKAAKSHLRERL
jgi:hypothetical protein